MTDNNDIIGRVKTLRRQISEANEKRARAQATKEQAESALQEILKSNDVGSVEELEAKAAQAQADAERLLAEAEQEMA